MPLTKSKPVDLGGTAPQPALTEPNAGNPDVAMSGALAAAEKVITHETEKPAPPKRKSNPKRAGFGQELTDYDMQIQRQISRAGLWQAAMQSLGVVQFNTDASLEGYLNAVEKACERGLKYIHAEDGHNG